MPRIEFGKLQVKIDGVNIARGHGRKIECFARRVGAREIQPNVIAHHESHDRQRDILDARER